MLRAFRTEDSPRIIVMGLLCGNVGLTLTSPRYPIDVLVADLDWSPSQIAQAVKRVYRPSQTFPVTAYTVLTHRSMDMDMLDLVYRKSKGIAQALDKVNPDEVERPEPMSQREMLDELARRIEERQAREAVKEAKSLMQQKQVDEALAVLRGALRLQTLSHEVWEELVEVSKTTLEQAMALRPKEKGRFQDSLDALVRFARRRHADMEQAELMKAA